MYMHHQHQQQLGTSQHNGSLIDICDTFRLGDNHFKDSDHKAGSSIVDYNKGESGKNSMSDEDDPSFTEEGQNEAGKVKKGSPWHRMKWTDAMVKLLITGVSYVGDDALDCNIGGKRGKHMILQKKGKWKAISKVMAERGCCVSPQQCEDKFNDLNKRYKRLTDILGRGTSCKVVENPVLLDRMNHLTEKEKDAARKILNSKHLFYEEMCSYHNCNRLNLPHDPALQRSIQLALNSKDEHDTKRGSHEDFDEDYHSTDSDEDGDDHNNTFHGGIEASGFPKSTGLGIDDHMKLANCSHSQDYKENYQAQAQGLPVDINRLLSENSDPQWMNQQLSHYSRELEEKRLHIEAEMLEIEEQKFKWQRFSEKKNRELNRMMLETERMKIENERMSLMLRQKKLEIDLAVKRNQ